VSPDGKTWKFNLRQDVNFVDRTPFNADAAVYNILRWKNFPQPLQVLDYYDKAVFGGYGKDSNIVSAETNGPFAITITLNHSQATFLLALTLPPFSMQSPTALKNHNADLGADPRDDYWQKTPTGTGPFMFNGDFVSGDHYAIVRNPNYWNKAAQPYLDKIVFKPIAQSAQRVAALRAGTVDIIDLVDASQLGQIKGDPTLQLLIRKPLAVGWIAFNQRHKPLNDLKVRQTIAYAVEKKAIVDAFFPGLGQVADSDILPSFPAYEPGVYAGQYDPAKAKSLLVGSSCPAPCTVDFWYPDNVSRPYMVDPKGEFEAIRPMLEAAGFQITPQHTKWQQYLTNEANGRYGLFLIGGIYDYADPASSVGLNYSRSASECDGKVPAQPINCEYGEENPRADNFMRQAIAEPNPAKSTQLWKQAMRLFGADLPKVPIVWAASALAAKKTVKGYIQSPTQAEFLNVVWKQPSP
jgi:peptide/nickel transport system substrate-binding protein